MRHLVRIFWFQPHWGRAFRRAWRQMVPSRCDCCSLLTNLFYGRYSDGCCLWFNHSAVDRLNKKICCHLAVWCYEHLNWCNRPIYRTYGYHFGRIRHLTNCSGYCCWHGHTWLVRLYFHLRAKSRWHLWYPVWWNRRSLRYWRWGYADLCWR